MRPLSRKQFLGCAAIGLGAALYPSLKWFTSGNPESETTPLEDGYRELPALISEVMTQFGIPGLSFALITAFGEGVEPRLRRERFRYNVPVTTETSFQAGSLTKPVFARAVLALVERKILDLDQPIAPYLPDELIDKEPRLKLVTARMFLSHTSGIAGPLDAPAFNFAPGERFEYASRGFQLMQMAVERLTGLSLARFVDSNVLEPCGMRNSSIGWTMTQWWRVAQGHFKNGKSRATRIKWEPSAAAGLLTTAGDYARFMQDILRSKREMLKP